MKFIPAVVLIMAGLLFVACDHHDEPVTFSYTQLTPRQLADADATRTRVGLPTLDGNWFLYRSRVGEDEWKRRDTDSIMKKVFLDSSNNILSEENYYLSGAAYTNFEGLGFESLTVHYDYPDGKMGVGYIGTNIVTKTALDAVSLPFNTTTNCSKVLAAVRAATAGWRYPVR